MYVMAAGNSSETQGGGQVDLIKTKYTLNLDGRWISCFRDVECMSVRKFGKCFPFDAGNLICHDRDPIVADPLYLVRDEECEGDLDSVECGATLLFATADSRATVPQSVARHIEPVRTGPWNGNQFNLKPRALFRYPHVHIHRKNGHVSWITLYRWEIELSAGVLLHTVGRHCPLDPFNHEFVVIPRTFD